MRGFRAQADRKGPQRLCHCAASCPVLCVQAWDFLAPTNLGASNGHVTLRLSPGRGTMCGMGRVWFLEVKGLPSRRASSLFHILKDPDFSLLFLLLTQRLRVPLWTWAGAGGSWCWRWGPGGWDLCIPAYEKASSHSGKTSFGDTLLLCGRLRQQLPDFCVFRVLSN